ncbi:MAG: hypothetical protein AAFP90_20630, partial [Planctomycetota bacterium]
VTNTLRRIDQSQGQLVGCMLNVYQAGDKFEKNGESYGYYESDYINESQKPRRGRRAATLIQTPKVEEETVGVGNGRVRRNGD